MLSKEKLRLWAQPEPLHAAWQRAGLEDHSIVGERLIARLCQFPDRLAVVDGADRLSNGELVRRANVLATLFLERGVEPGDVVSWQIPNWWEAATVALATWQVGAVNNPIVMIYRSGELNQILSEMQPKVVITTEEFRGCQHAALFDEVLTHLDSDPMLRIVVRSTNPSVAWETLTYDPSATDAAVIRPPSTVTSSDPCVVAYTSGTTSGAKGVIVDSRGLLAETRQMRETWGIDYRDVAFMPAPFAHLTGLIVGLTVPVTAGGSVALQDVWRPAVGVDLIAQEGCTYSSGSTIFLQGLVEEYERRGVRSSLREYSCGGSAIPASLIDRAEAVGIGAFRCYGMTEHMSTTIANSALPMSIRRDTDGPIGPGSEVSCIDDDGNLLDRGVEGQIRVRGPERMLGYVKETHNRASLDADGWFRTGDVGFVDANGCVHVTGRLKDIINRGGEKFSAREIEDVLVNHPGLRAVAVVPMTDLRYGEVPMAFFVPVSEVEPPTEDDLAAFALSTGLAKPKLPVLWRSIAELPTTPFGKVHKPSLLKLLVPEVSSEAGSL